MKTCCGLCSYIPAIVILLELGEKLGRYTEKKLAERGVEIRVNTRVIGVTDSGVQLSTGEQIESKALIWTAGTSPNPVLDSLPCVKERGRLKVDEMLRVPLRPLSMPCAKERRSPRI